MNIGDKLYCKKRYYYNGWWNIGDRFEVIGFNEYNVRIQSMMGTYQNISYKQNYDVDVIGNYIDTILLFEIFYTECEYRKEKLRKINECRL